MTNGLRFRDLKSVPDTMRAAVQRALARDDAMAAGRSPKRKREPKASMADSLPAFFGYDLASGPDETVLRIQLAMRSGRGQNDREHWATRMRRVRHERQQSRLAMLGPARKVSLPAVVTLTRLSPGTLDDDNLCGALKAIRDGVADALGIDDRDPRVTWRYAQIRARRGEWAVTVEVSQV